MNKVLQFNNVVKSYGKDSLILDGASFDIQQGQVVAMVGASGCGKSTVLHCAGLLDMIDSGSVFIDGTDTTAAADKVRTYIRRQKIGVVYQFHNLLSEFNVWENVAYPLWLQGIHRKTAHTQVLSLLSDVGMLDKADAKTRTLSGGQAQRVAIARCLAGNPSIILADEPTGNLDEENSKIVWSVLLNTVRTHNTAMLCVTHDMNLAKTADKIYTIKDKKICSV